MSFRDLFPLMIYDDRCYLCSKVAGVVHTITRNRIFIIGHYSDKGKKIKSEIFEQNYDSTRMFWLITEKTAYGGRAAIFPLLHRILVGKSRRGMEYEQVSSCNHDCRTFREFLARTKSLLANSEKMSLGKN